MWTTALIDYRWTSDGTTLTPTAPYVNISLSGELTAGDVTVSNLTGSLGVYTDPVSQLTSTPPVDGVLGYWQRDDVANAISTATALDRLIINNIISLSADGSIAANYLGIGASADLRIYHDGTDSYINNALTGSDLYLITKGGDTGAPGTNAGSFFLSGGIGGGGSGLGAVGGDGGNSTVSAGAGGTGGAPLGTGGDGGDANITAGAGGASATDGDGGNVNLTAGLGDTEGCINFIGSETLVLDLSVGNTATFSSTTGITVISFTAIGLTTTGAVTAGASTFGDGGATNYSQFEADGTLEFNGEATVWDDKITPLTRATFGGTANDPTLTKLFDDAAGTSGGVWALVFQNGDEVLITAQLPHRWKEGTDIYPHIHFITLTDVDPSDNFGIEFEYTWCDLDEDFATDTILTTDDVPTGINSQYMHQFVDLASGGFLDGTGHTISSVLMIRIKRVAATVDDYAGGVAILDFDIHYEINTLGSRAILTK